jgi:hypothetical protein
MQSSSFGRSAFASAARTVGRWAFLLFLFSVVSFVAVVRCASAATPEDVRLNSTTHKPINAAIDLSDVTLSLGNFSVTDSAGVRIFTLGHIHGTKIGGPLDLLGFYDAAPIVRPSSTTDLRQALINLGLYTTGGASPLNLNGGAFTAATGAFSGNETVGGTFSATGNSTFGGALGITGALSGSSYSFTGNGSVGGTLGVTGLLSGSSFSFSSNGTIGGTLGITGALTGSSSAFSGNETVGGTFSATGNSTFGGALGITGALSGSSYSFTGDGTVSGNFRVSGTSTLGAVTATTGAFSSTLSSAAFSATSGAFSSTLNVTGNTVLGGSLSVTGLGGVSITGGLSALSGAFSSGMSASSGIFSGSVTAASETLSGALNAASGAFSGALSSPNVSFTGGTLSGITSFGGGSLTLTGNESVGGTFAATGNSTFGGTLGITGALSGSSFSFSSNGTIGGTLGVTGAFSGSSGLFSTTFGALGLATLPHLTGTIEPTAGLAGLSYIDVKWYGVDITGVADSTTAFNNARAAARTAHVPLFISGKVKVTSTIAVTTKEDWVGINIDGVTTGESTILWAGASGGTAVTFTGVVSPHLSYFNIDGGNLAANCLILDAVTHGTFEHIFIDNFTTGVGVKLTGASGSSSFNTFNGLLISYTNHTSVTAGLWLTGGGTQSDPNATFNSFTQTSIEGYNTTKPGIKLGNCDSNFFNNTWIGTNNASAPGVLCDPAALVDFSRPNGNTFVGISTGPGGWVQPGTSAFITPNYVYRYGKGNGEPDPQLNGSGGLYWDDEFGNEHVNNITAATITAGSAVNVQLAGPASVQNFNLLAYDYATTFKSVFLALGGNSAGGTIGGIAAANTGGLIFQNLNNAVVGTNNAVPITFPRGRLSERRARPRLAARPGSQRHYHPRHEHFHFAERLSSHRHREFQHRLERRLRFRPGG